MTSKPPADADARIAALIASLDTHELKAIVNGDQDAMQRFIDALDPPGIVSRLTGTLLGKRGAFNNTGTRSAFGRRKHN